MLWLIRFLLGYAKIEIKGIDLIGVVNEISNLQIKVWDFNKKKDALVGKCQLQCLKQLQDVSKKYGCAVIVKSKHGIPYILDKYRARTGILAGLIFMTLFLTIMPNFIWKIEIEGNEKVSSDYIKSKLAEIGVHEGVFFPTLKLVPLQKQLELEFSELSYFAINRNASKLTVQVRELNEKIEILDNDQPCNIVSTKTGQITSIIAKYGKKMVKVNDVVKKGDVLISGFIEYERENTQPRYVHAAGQVMAQTFDVKTFSQEYVENRKVYLEEIEKKSLNLFGLNIPLDFNKTPKGSFDIETKTDNVSVFGYNLPIVITQQTYAPYYIKEEKLSKTQLLEKIKEKVKNYEENALINTEILSKKETEIYKDNELVVEVEYLCLEQIGEISPIEIQTE